MTVDSTNPKGLWMKSHIVLLSRVLEDSSIRCCTSTTRDLKTIVSRVENEGLSFLTITLPEFAKDFERCLDAGSVDSTLFVGFSKSGPLPRFLQGLTSLVFDKKTGVLLNDPSIDAIQSVRQVCYLFKKLNLPCSDARVKAAFDSFVECEKSVRSFDMHRSWSQMADFQRVSWVLFRELLTDWDQKVYNGEVIPNHGPGSTADRLFANAKFDNRLWTERLEKLFYAGEFLFTNWRAFYENSSSVHWLEPGSEIPVRVISVPKTLKTPRIIAIEPTHMQYVQQGLKDMIVEGIERDNLLHHFIGFSDQTYNQNLAQLGSRTGDLATLDLSEASDRVSNQLVEIMLANTPTLREGVDACRSYRADVPGHGVLPLAKFASMGSALTFPIEAMVFLTIVFLGIEEELNTPLTPKLLKEFKGQVRVYGDDIIVPVNYVRSVVEHLEAFGLKVNSNKSFWTGKFRESCGGDFYDGYNVTVVKATTKLPSVRKHVQEIISTVSLRNQFYEFGYWRTAEYLDNVLVKVIPFPSVHPNSPGLGRHTFLEYETQRVCPYLQRPLVKAAVVNAIPPRSPVSGDGALLKYFLKRGDEPFADKKHLERAGRPDAVNIKLRWVPPY